MNTRSIAVTGIVVRVTDEDGEAVVAEHSSLRIPKDTTIEQAIEILRTFETDRMAQARNLDATLPESLCGAIHPFATADAPAYQRCVFLKNHKGDHSWQK